MPAYLISHVSVKNADAFKAYWLRAAISVQQHGGRYLVRGGPVDTLEGSWAPTTIIVVEFPDIERARAWYCSPEYAVALAFQDEALSHNLFLVDGFTGSG